MSSSTRKPGIHVAWKTVTYRSVALLILAGAGCFLSHALHLPAVYREQRKGNRQLCQPGFGASGGNGSASGPRSFRAQQAHFTALDGTVRVKKANGNSWVAADYNIPLEKGDVVQTSSEGMAKVVFNDGTSYTVKQDSLIVIEENSANDQQQTNVAVAVSTGTVIFRRPRIPRDRSRRSLWTGRRHRWLRNRRRRCTTIPRRISTKF